MKLLLWHVFISAPVDGHVAYGKKGEDICQYDCLSNTDIIHDIVLILTHYSNVRDSSKAEGSLQRSILYVMCHLAISYLQRKV